MYYFWQRRSWAGLFAAAVLAVVALAGCPTAATSSGTVEGTWAGSLSSTYYCEGSPETIQFSITGTTVTITGGTAFATETAGSITKQTEQAYTIELDIEGIVDGQLFIDTAKNYALLVIRSSAGGNYGFVGVLQKGALSAFTCQQSDLLGTWAGVAARVDANFQVTNTSTSTATISDSEGLVLSGSDGDGTFGASAPAIILEPGYQTAGIFVSGWSSANQIGWPDLEASFDALYALSFDKKVLAVAFLTSVCSSSIFDNLPSQKFALWVRQ
jgi:hypothetical protein